MVQFSRNYIYTMPPTQPVLADTSAASKTSSWYQPLCRATSLSKILAAIIFIVMPFIGGYVGYQLAGDRVIHVDVSGEQSPAIWSLPKAEKYTIDNFPISFNYYPATWSLSTSSGTDLLEENQGTLVFAAGLDSTTHGENITFTIRKNSGIHIDGYCNTYHYKYDGSDGVWEREGELLDDGGYCSASPQRLYNMISIGNTEGYVNAFLQVSPKSIFVPISAEHILEIRVSVENNMFLKDVSDLSKDVQEILNSLTLEEKN